MVKSMKGIRTDLHIEKCKHNLCGNIKVYRHKENNNLYNTIYFSNVIHKDKIKKALIEELKYFLEILKLSNNYHAFVVGLGSFSHTADSVGPNVLKNLQVNSHFEKIGIATPIKVSALEPGIIKETGIDTKRIVESVVEEIKPDVVILIDSFVTESSTYLNHTIEITNEGIIPGSGVKGINAKICKETLDVPVIVIGVPTAIEIKLEDNINYLLATSNIDSYIEEISIIIGDALNSIFYK